MSALDLTDRHSKLWDFVEDAADTRPKLIRRAYGLNVLGRLVEPRAASFYIVTTPDRVVTALARAAKRRPPTSGLEAVAATSHWAENVARLAQARFAFTAEDIRRIKQVAAIQESISSSFYGRLGFKGVVGVVLGVAALLASQLPKEVFGRYGGDYVLFRVALAGAVLAGVIIAGIVWYVVRHWAARRARDTRLFNAVVVYLDLLATDADPAPQPPPI